VFLSATPVTSEEFQAIAQNNLIEMIEFKDSIGKESDKMFNYPLQLYIEECRYTRLDVMLERLRKYFPIIPKPLAIIFDSVFRLRHIKPILEREFGKQFVFMNIVE